MCLFVEKRDLKTKLWGQTICFKEENCSYFIKKKDGGHLEFTGSKPWRRFQPLGFDQRLSKPDILKILKSCVHMECRFGFPGLFYMQHSTTNAWVHVIIGAYSGSYLLLLFPVGETEKCF
ncbi:unnamed protein product [Allacma fusca]|uniref:Uncharacterized protein n=1 Tax=Allacma fusca TaxID=39272 RepID=A0A8J2NVF7_9HEXA|nr:unnamed protein product [Allacma fusca]